MFDPIDVFDSTDDLAKRLRAAVEALQVLFECDPEAYLDAVEGDARGELYAHSSEGRPGYPDALSDCRHFIREARKSWDTDTHCHLDQALDILESADETYPPHYVRDEEDEEDEDRSLWMSDTAPSAFDAASIPRSWGGLTRTLPKGCVSCGDKDADPTRIVPEHLAGAQFASRENQLPLCVSCRVRWEGAAYEAKYVAALLLGHGRNLPPSVLQGKYVKFLSVDELRRRDGLSCRVCDTAHPSGELEAGHLLSRKSAELWDVPMCIVNHPSNVVVMCRECNSAIGPASPSLRVAMRFLIKPWIETNHNNKEHEQ